MAVTVFRNLGYLGFSRETTQGTPVAPASFVKLRKQMFMISQEFEDIRNGNVEDINNSVKKFLSYKGAFQTYLYPDEGGRLLTGALGKDVVSGAGDPWTHTITLLDALPFYTFEADFNSDQIIDRITDCKIDTFKLTAQAGELADLDISLFGCNPIGQGSPATVTFTDGVSEGPMVMHQGVFTLTGPTDATTLQGQIQQLMLTISRNITVVKGPGSLVPIYLIEGVRKFDLRLVVEFSGPNIYQLTHFGANAATTASPTTGTGSLVAKFTSQAAPEHSIQITAPQFSFQHAAPAFSPSGELAVMTVDAVGYRSGATLPLSVIVKNAIATQFSA